MPVAIRKSKTTGFNAESEPHPGVRLLMALLEGREVPLGRLRLRLLGCILVDQSGQQFPLTVDCFLGMAERMPDGDLFAAFSGGAFPSIEREPRQRPL